MLDSSMRGGCHVYSEVSQFKGRVEQTERWQGVEKNDSRRNSEDRLLGWRTIILKIPKFLQRPTFLSSFFFFFLLITTLQHFYKYRLDNNQVIQHDQWNDVTCEMVPCVHLCVRVHLSALCGPPSILIWWKWAQQYMGRYHLSRPPILVTKPRP